MPSARPLPLRVMYVTMALIVGRAVGAIEDVPRRVSLIEVERFFHLPDASLEDVRYSFNLAIEKWATDEPFQFPPDRSQILKRDQLCNCCNEIRAVLNQVPLAAELELHPLVSVGIHGKAPDHRLAFDNK